MPVEYWHKLLNIETVKMIILHIPDFEQAVRFC
jgi:hypothetical protein